MEHLREDVMSAVEQTPEQSVAFTQDDAEIAKDVTLATSTGLEDGTRIERRGGWVVIDSFYSYLADPEDGAWVTDPDDEDMPAARFDTPEAAYRAWMRSEEVAAAGAKRRAEALRILGRGDWLIMQHPVGITAGRTARRNHERLTIAAVWDHLPRHRRPYGGRSLAAFDDHRERVPGENGPVADRM